MKKKILIVDDHFVVLTGVSIILEESFEDIILSTKENFADTLDFLKTNEVDLIILDINIPGGKNKEMISDIRNIQPNVLIIIFSVYEENTHASQYILAGANGYLNKFSDKDKIVLAIDSVLKSGNFIPNDLIHSIINSSNNKDHLNPIEKLTDRELEICELLLKGFGNIEISNKLDIKMTTVSTHKNKIFFKLKIKNIVELIALFDTYKGL